MADRLLFVTQVAPYADGPAGVHGVLDQAAVGVAQVAELHGLAAAARRRRARRSTRRELRDARALALFTIGETPWSATQRGAILDGVRAGTLAVLLDPLRDRLVLRLGRVRRARRRPLRRPSVDADVHRRRARPDASRVRAPRRRVAVARRGVPVPRPARPTRRCCCACATVSSTSTRRARGRRRSATRSRGASREGRRAGVLDEPRALPGRVGDARRTCGTSRAASGGRSARRDARERAQLLELGVLAAAARGERRRRSVPARRPRAQIEPWRARVRERLDAMLGPAPEPVPLDLETTETVDCGTYRRERVVFDTEATMSVPAYLLVPHDRAEPGPGGARDPRSRSGQGAHLRRRRDEAHDEGARTRTCSRARATSCSRPTCAASASAPTGCPTTSTTATGTSCARRWPASSRTQRNLWDLQRALDVLAAHPLVDPGRIGAAGLSYGATCTLFLAAIDDRVRAAIVSRATCRRGAPRTRCRGTCAVRRSCPARSARSSISTSPSLIAPRPLLVENGDRRRHLPGRRRARHRRVAAARVRAARRARRRARARRVRRRPPVARHRDVRLPGAVAVSDRRPARGARAHAAGSVPAARSARRGRRARRPDAHVGSAAARPRGRARASRACSGPTSRSSRARRRRAGAR